ncbi:inhibitor of g-type lysozyme [Escherichia marmotae]|nr:inhibitor of g-type lysozyme [Escherichia marmotae]
MVRIRKAVLLFALLTSTSFAAGKNVNVEFRKGHSSAQYSGEIKGYDYDTSRYYAELGRHGQYSLPASGKYELRVLQTRNDARKNKTKKYNVDIQIK